MEKSDSVVTLESFNSLTSYWFESPHPSMWNCIFALPPWLEVWWQEFGYEAELYLGAVRQAGAIIGIAPLQIKGSEASFVGSTDVCDYLDFSIVPGREVDFLNILLDDLERRGISRLNLRPLRHDSNVLTHLIGVARDRDCAVSCKTEDISLKLDLPPTWQEYLGLLTQKQRHEVRRKMRRFSEAGEVNYLIAEDSRLVSQFMVLFLKFFRESRKDKAIFLTDRMESFFMSIAKAMGQEGFLRLGILELNALPVAAVMCLDYNGTVFLYNNGYDPQYGSLSPGLISKVLCIKDSIERGRGIFDFLKGAEEYKHRLGGKEITLYSCQISLD